MACNLPTPFSRVRNTPLPALPTYSIASVALSLDAGLVGFPNDNGGAGSLQSYDVHTGVLTLLSRGPDGGIFFDYAESVAVDDTFSKLAVVLPVAPPPMSGWPSGAVELRNAAGGLLSRYQGAYNTAAWCARKVALSGDGRTLVYSCGTALDFQEIGVRRVDGGYTAAAEFQMTYGDDFELDRAGNNLSTVTCTATQCALSVYGAVQTNIVSPVYESPPLAGLTDTSSVEVEASRAAEWVAVGGRDLGANGEGAVYVLMSNGVGYELATTLRGTLSMEKLGAALAMDDTGDLLLVGRQRGQSTSVYVRRSLADGGVEYCEAQRLDVGASSGTQLALSPDGRRILVVGLDGGLQYFAR